MKKKRIFPGSVPAKINDGTSLRTGQGAAAFAASASTFAAPVSSVPIPAHCFVSYQFLQIGGRNGRLKRSAENVDGKDKRRFSAATDYLSFDSAERSGDHTHALAHLEALYNP